MNDQQIIDALKGAVGVPPDLPGRVEHIRSRASRARHRRLSEGLGCVAVAVAVVAGTVAVDRAAPARVIVADDQDPVSSLAEAVRRTTAASPVSWEMTTRRTYRGPLNGPLASSLREPRTTSGRWNFDGPSGKSTNLNGREMRYVGGQLYVELDDSDRGRLPSGSGANWTVTPAYADIEAASSGVPESVRAPVVLLAMLRDTTARWQRAGSASGEHGAVARYQVTLAPTETSRTAQWTTESSAVVDVDARGRIRRVVLRVTYTWNAQALAALRTHYETQAAEAQRKLDETIEELKREHPEQAALIERQMRKSPMTGFNADDMINMLTASTETEMTFADFGKPLDVDAPPAVDVIARELLEDFAHSTEDDMSVSGGSSGTLQPIDVTAG
jgi:hypothetical protein